MQQKKKQQILTGLLDKMAFHSLIQHDPWCPRSTQQMYIDVLQIWMVSNQILFCHFDHRINICLLNFWYVYFLLNDSKFFKKRVIFKSKDTYNDIIINQSTWIGYVKQMRKNQYEFHFSSCHVSEYSTWPSEWAGLS